MVNINACISFPLGNYELIRIGNNGFSIKGTVPGSLRINAYLFWEINKAVSSDLWEALPPSILFFTLNHQLMLQQFWNIQNCKKQFCKILLYKHGVIKVCAFSKRELNTALIFIFLMKRARKNEIYMQFWFKKVTEHICWLSFFPKILFKW